jgi:tRNA dimethylallyltransferase
LTCASQPELIVVVGPTASGKTELALRIAELAGGEIVNADSVQVYRHFDIGSAKPSPAQAARVTHHLVDVVEPSEPLDAAQWCALAEAAISDIGRRGRRAIVSGGTFLWVKALLYGLVRAPPADPELRERHRRFALSYGRPALHEKLAHVDPLSAARLNPNDFVRVSRALEVFELSGEPLSSLQEAHRFQSQRYPARLVGVARERSELDQRILERTEQMFRAGWLEEVRALLARGFADCRAMRSVGYRQISEALQRAEPFDAAQLEASVVRATRIFARRQRTWLKDQPVHWVPADILTNQGATLQDLLTEQH